VQRKINPKVLGAELILFQNPRIAEIFVDCIYQYPQILVCVSDYLPTVTRNDKIIFPGTLLSSVSTSDHGKQV
jgi:hypothetical protein